MKLGICAYPLSKGKETGRGLDRVIDELYSFLQKNQIEFDFYERKSELNLKGSASTKEELKTISASIPYSAQLIKKKNTCYLATYPVAGIFPSFLGKKPLITAVHDLIPYFVFGYDKGLKYAIKRWSIKYCCIKSDYLIVPFRSTKEKIVEMFHVSPDKIFVIPYGVDHTTYFPDPSIEKKKYRIAFLGEAKRAKGMDSVIKAFRIIKETLPEATLVLASQGNELEQMKTLAKDLLPENSYEFAGFVAENKMREFYNTADIFVYPSRYGFGLSALEAMSCGTPVIAGATLDATDFIDDEEMLVDPENSFSLAQKVLFLISNRDIYRQKSEKVKEIAQKYSWIKMAEEYYTTCLFASKNFNK